MVVDECTGKAAVPASMLSAFNSFFYSAESNDASASGENITLTKDTTDGGTVEAEPPQEKGSDDGNRVSKQGKAMCKIN